MFTATEMLASMTLRYVGGIDKITAAGPLLVFIVIPGVPQGERPADVHLFGRELNVGFHLKKPS